MNTEVKAEIEKLWKALTNLDKADIQTTALCHAIVTLMIDKGLVTQEQAAKELEKSIVKVLTVHKQIAKVMQNQNSAFGAQARLKTLQ